MNSKFFVKTDQEYENEIPTDIPTDINTPYYKDKYYKDLGNGIFEIISKDSDYLENVKYFDFEYYNTHNSTTKNTRIFYLLYFSNNKYYLKQYKFNNKKSKDISISLPIADQYFLITDTIPTFSAGISESFDIEDLNINFFDSYINRPVKEIVDGDSPNPRKILFKFKLKKSSGGLIYDDKANFSVRTTSIKFLIKN